MARNIHYMLTVLPATWPIEDIFPGWTEMAAWALKNQNALIELAGETLKENRREEIALGALVTLHPMKDFGLSRFPIYSTLCDIHELPEQRKHFAMLQAQLLVARRKELEKNKAHNSDSYVDLYERHTEEGDFARHVRQPDAAARAIRKISFERYGQMLAFIHPERSPGVFASSLPEPGDELPQIPFLHKGLQHIRHYCGLKTSPRSNVTRIPGDSYGGGGGIYGYVEYSETRFGIEYTNGDPDDSALDQSQQELICENSVDRESALAQDFDPAETALPGGYARQGDEQQSGSTPGKLASARTRVAMIEIDKDRMPWSAIHLRPSEITGTLLAKLASTAEAARFGRVDAVELENCALMAVCLETARPLKAVLGMRLDRVPEGDFLFVPSDHDDEVSQWCWKTIEPLYKAERPSVSGRELVRSLHLSYPVHPVANHLLREWQKHLQGPRPELFHESLEVYEKRLKPWLRRLDSTGRLTLSKIAHLKWSLLSQVSAGDIAEASLVLGQPHPMARVPLFYSLLSVDGAADLFQRATSVLWRGVWGDGQNSYRDRVPA
ncbi:hypothetical protein [Tunturiibacter gelidiferens]|uniref:hypothetical protein n=1 Tax=Tunturiibacter gelidiferens TaxID=3069689 RepID=UPI003D9BF4C5